MLNIVATLALASLPATGPAAMDGSVASADGVMIHFHAEGRGDPVAIEVNRKYARRFWRRDHAGGRPFSDAGGPQGVQPPAG